MLMASVQPLVYEQHTFEEPEETLSERLGHSLVVVRLEVSNPAQRRKDREATENLAASTGADTKMVNVSKAPFKSDALVGMRKIHQQANSFLDEHSIRWETGERIIPLESITEVISELERFKSQYETQKEELKKELPQMIQDAPHLLGTLYKRDDYRQMDSHWAAHHWVEQKFQFHLGCEPLVTDNSFLGSKFDQLESQQRSVLEKYRLEGEANSRYTAARDMYTRVNKVMDRLTTQLKGAKPGGKKPKLYDSLLEEAQRLVDLLGGGCNFGNDPLLEEARVRLRDLLSKCSGLDELREDDDLRKDMQEEAAQIRADVLAKMDSKFRS
jgi:hypothetical protein|tara:strand:- start:84 stop:1067 length:984 start_codon:yes stop_codon:yes gene_type:complete